MELPGLGGVAGFTFYGGPIASGAVDGFFGYWAWILYVGLHRTVDAFVAATHGFGGR